MSDWGAIFASTGYRNRFELLNEHLARVQELCSQYGFAPMMWSDMFFKFGSVKGEYYDPDGTVPAEVCGQIPEIGLVYWDYYQTDREAYTRMIKKHQNMGRPVVFAGRGLVLGRIFAELPVRYGMLCPRFGCLPGMRC